jgi:hypothetical protein
MRMTSCAESTTYLSTARHYELNKRTTLPSSRISVLMPQALDVVGKQCLQFKVANTIAFLPSTSTLVSLDG